MIQLALLLALATAQDPPRRAVAVTFDDLPVAGRTVSIAARESVTAGLLRAIGKHRVPAIGFVNEMQLEDAAGRADPRQLALLRRWLDAGLELGNHTWGHPDLHRVTLAEFTADLLRGERQLRPLLAARQQAPRFFRHPFLHTGRSVAVRDSLHAFLATHGYRVAPVTIDNSDYVFASAYLAAREARDTAQAARIAAEYLDYMERVVTWYEGQSVAIAGREIPQVLLLHANALNAATFDRLCAMLRGRGYRFVPLADVLEDPVYQLPDTYAGPAGISWLHRWALTRQMPTTTYAGEPQVAGWVQEIARR